MSYKDFEHYVKKGGSTAMLMLALEASAINAAAQERQAADSVQEQKGKTEYVEKKVNLFGVTEIEQVEQDGQVYNKVGEEFIDQSQLDPKKLHKAWKADEKYAFANAEPDRTDTLSVATADKAGAYSTEDKNIVMTYIEMGNEQELHKLEAQFADKHPEMSPEQRKKTFVTTLEMFSDLNNPQSAVYKSVKAHEEQHRSNDKLGIYAPGLSPEQYGILCQYDECAATVAELNGYLAGYRNELAKGTSREEALKVFDKEPDFAFYKEALAKGLDPDSKEGKKLMVEGSFEMWKNKRRTMNAYKQQISQFGTNTIGTSDLSATLIGNDQELQKRINKIFDNICENDYCRKEGIKSPGNLSKYLPEQTMELLPEVRAEIESGVKEKTGISADQREAIKQSVDGKTDKKKNRNLLQVLTGRKSPQQVAAKKTMPQTDRGNAAVQKAIADEKAKGY